MKHREIFKQIYGTRYYKYFWCVIAGYITAAPILVLEDPRDGWQLTHYNIVEILNILLLLDPVLVLVFMGTKNFKRSYFYTIEIFGSVGLIGLSVVSDFLIPEKGKSFEETNHNYFLVYSIFCVLKVLRIFDQVLSELPQTKAVVNVLVNLGPFLGELMGMMFNLFLIFGQLGMNMFGGNINSKTPKEYKEKVGRTLPLGYETLNFNDFPNACVFLWTIFTNNNWLELSYMALLELPDEYDEYTKYFFVAFTLLTSFFILNVIIGFIVEVILSYLNQKYNKNIKLSDAAIEAIRDNNEYSESSESDESDENAFVDDEAEKDIEAKIRDLFNNLNKGLASNVKAFGQKEDEDQKEFEMQRRDEIPII